MKKLNGWQRLWVLVVLLLGMALGGLGYVFYPPLDFARASYNEEMESRPWLKYPATDEATAAARKEEAKKVAEKTLADLREQRQEFVISYVAAWVVFSIFLYVLGWLVAWVRRGFRQSKNE